MFTSVPNTTVKTMTDRCLQKALYRNQVCINRNLSLLERLHKYNSFGWLAQELRPFNITFQSVEILCEKLSGPKDYERSRRILNMLAESYMNIVPKLKFKRGGDFSFKMGAFKLPKDAIKAIFQFEKEVLRNSKYKDKVTAAEFDMKDSKVRFDLFCLVFYVLTEFVSSLFPIISSGIQNFLLLKKVAISI